VRIYFARCYIEYGTPEDDAIQREIYYQGHELVDPSGFDEEEYKLRGMEFYLEKVRQCDMLFYKTVGAGRVTAGVAREILEAKIHGIDVAKIKIEDGRIYTVRSFFGLEDVMTIAETRDYIEKARNK
jgi:hypothetical protein